MNNKAELLRLIDVALYRGGAELKPHEVSRVCMELESLLTEPSQEDRLREALQRIANMTDRDGNLIEMHREELRAIARTALRAAQKHHPDCPAIPDDPFGHPPVIGKCTCGVSPTDAKAREGRQRLPTFDELPDVVREEMELALYTTVSDEDHWGTDAAENVYEVVREAMLKRGPLLSQEWVTRVTSSDEEEFERKYYGEDTGVG